MQRLLQRGSADDSPKTPRRNSDLEFNDFNDVFGGPPRRFSAQERRHSDESDANEIESGNPWSAINEKPVFGEETLNRRRYPSNDFFDDIFKGGESSCSSPRKYEREVLSSSPASRAMSPARPLPPKAEPFGTSLPAQFSLPAKLNKGIDLPTFGSPTGSSLRIKDGVSSNSSSYLFSPLSKSSTKAEESQEKLKNGLQETEVRNSMNDSDNSSQFHFSIYKWGIKDIPLAMPVRGGNGSRLKEKDKPERSLNQIACESMAKGVEDGEIRENVNETTLPSGEAEVVLNVHDDVDKGEESAPVFPFESDKPAKESSVVMDTSQNSALKTLKELFYVDHEEKGNVEKPEKAGRKESGNKVKKPPAVLPAVENIKKKDVGRNSLDSADVRKTSMPGSPRNSGKSKVKGKVKDFVKMFNQDAVSRPRTDVASNNQSSGQKDGGAAEVENKVDVSVSEAYAKMQRPSMRKETSLPDITVMVDDNFEKTEKQESTTSDPKYAKDNASEKKENTAKNANINDSKTVFGDPYDSFEVKEIIEDEKEEPKNNSDREGTQLVDSKIRQWSTGKLGNIRSLLSTLQYVLWPDSGWKPVPLMDIIEGNSVKRSYQRALLCLHPDKLQQKGATSQQKYIAEKVFDILQDAWTHFNTLGPV